MPSLQKIYSITLGNKHLNIFLFLSRSPHYLCASSLKTYQERQRELARWSLGNPYRF